MGKKCKCPPAGAPDWVMTFGDMMSLLLTFFILLVSLSEIKEEDIWRAKAEVVKQSFGIHGGGGKVPSDADPTLSLMRKLERMYLQQQEEKRVSQTQDQAIPGRHLRVTQTREDLTRGIGKVTFEPGSADLSESARIALRPGVEVFKGHTNKIELHGHASSSELGVRSKYPDLWSLSFARAQAVKQVLVDEFGVKPERIRLVANADNEPMAKRKYTSRALEPNRRVEIRISNRLVDEFTQPVANAD